MSSPSIHILDDISALPEIEIVTDTNATFDIGSVDALDMGLLANQKKLGSPSRSIGGSGSDEIEFVNLDDSATTISYDVRPNIHSQTVTHDPIRIVRDSSAVPPARPIAPVPTPATSYTGMNNNEGSRSSGPSSWFSSPPVQTTENSGGGLAGKLSSWFGGNKGNGTERNEHSGGGSGGYVEQSSSTNTGNIRASEYLTPEQEFAKKSEALTMLERMDRKGITGNKMTMANTLDEVQAEVERRKDSKALEASIRFQRSMLTTVTNGMEFLNSRFDPLGIKLDGWSEQVNENIEDYDEMFEELYDKYKDKSKVAPEVRLIMSLGLSAAMCHVTNTMFKSRMPGMDDILRNNPDLARQFAQAAASQAVGPGFANFVGLGASGGGGSGNSRRPSMSPPPHSMGGGMRGTGGMGGMEGMFETMQSPSSPQPTARREMRGPSGVDDILRSLNQAGESMPDRSVPQPASPHAVDLEDVQSIRSGFTNATSSGRKRRTTQPVGATLTLNV